MLRDELEPIHHLIKHLRTMLCLRTEAWLSTVSYCCSFLSHSSLLCPHRKLVGICVSISGSTCQDQLYYPVSGKFVLASSPVPHPQKDIIQINTAGRTKNKNIDTLLFITWRSAYTVHLITICINKLYRCCNSKYNILK